jgi:hypothetical protein
VQLALADEVAEPAPIDPRLFGGRGRPYSAPLLPIAPAATDDRMDHLLLRSSSKILLLPVSGKLLMRSRVCVSSQSLFASGDLELTPEEIVAFASLSDKELSTREG